MSNITFPVSPSIGTEFIPGVRVPSRYRRAMYVVDGNARFIVNRPLLPHDPQPDDILHIWKDGEFLDLIAYSYYQDAALWWVIADFNELQDTRNIVAGQRLRLPSARRLQLDIAPLLR